MRYTFGNWELDLHLYELRRDGSPVKLEPQAFNMLAYLLQHRDRVVTRQELLEHLWVGQFIGDSAIERCVMAARKAVGDNGSVQRIIKTLHGRGYRFVASVQEVPPPAAVPPPAVEHAVPQSLLSAQPRAQAAATEILPTESMGHTCTVCQHVNRVQATFCEACGKQLAPTCLDQEPVADAPPSDPFWEPYAAARSLLVPASHAHTFSESAQTPYESLDGERKPVTVLCCALATDTSTTRQTEPDTLYQVTRQFYGYALEEVQRYGGTLQPVGDTELLALFGAPIAYEDHALRAILAALGLHRRLRHGPSRPHTSSVAIGPIRSGIHTGSVLVGYIGATRQLTYTAIGDTTDLARALQHQAEPGTILLSATAKRRVHDIVDVQLVQSKAGFEAATTVYTIRGLATPDTSSTPERASQPRRCVGREYELALLQALWKHAKTGQGQVVGIVGEAGMGKSRLLAEFRQQMQKTQVTYVEGRCVSYGSIVPYLPIRHILWHTCGLNETDNAQTLRTKVIRRLQEVGIDHDEDVLSVFQLLAGSGGPAVAGDVQLEILKDRTFAILRQLRLESCRQRPTIMVVEDLHWIDATSEAYLASLVARLATVPLLLITTYRPGYRPPWLATSYVTQLSLAPLTPSASLQVLRAMLQKTRLPTALTQQIIAQAAGNPFFLEELTRTALDQQDGTPARTVPDTIQTVVLARVDRLPPAAKQLLQAAAVIGIDAPVKLLQSLTELSAEQLHRSLAYLQEAELLHETQCVPNRVYTFKSTVIRDVVYGSLGAMRRQALQARLSAVSTTQGSPRPTQRDLPLVTHTLPHNGAQRVMQP